MRTWLTGFHLSDTGDQTSLIRGITDRGERVAALLPAELTEQLQEFISKMSRGIDLPLWKQEIVIVLRHVPVDVRQLYRRSGDKLEPAKDQWGDPILERVIDVSAIWPLFDLDGHHACEHFLFADGGAEVELEAAA